MSWREILGIHPIETSCMHNSHNTQKSTGTANEDNCANIADSAYRDLDDKDSGLLTALADICRGLSVTSQEVKEALSPEDINDWRRGTISKDTLITFAMTLVQRQEMNQGKHKEMK